MDFTPVLGLVIPALMLMIVFICYMIKRTKEARNNDKNL